MQGMPSRSLFNFLVDDQLCVKLADMELGVSDDLVETASRDTKALTCALTQKPTADRDAAYLQHIHL